jgi:hypothetical protein
MPLSLGDTVVSRGFRPLFNGQKMLVKDAGQLDQLLVELVHRQGMLGSFEHADSAAATLHLRSCVEHFVSIARVLNRAFRVNEDVLLLHDVRGLSGDGVAHIDHLIVTRHLDVFIVESCLTCDVLRITEDREFVASYFDGNRFMHRSLLRQLRRNSTWLRERLAGLDLHKKLSNTDGSNFHHIIVTPDLMRVENATRAVNVRFMRPDQLVQSVMVALKKSRIQTMFGSLTAGKLNDLGKIVARWHSPGKIDFLDKYRAVVSNVGLATEPVISGRGGVDTRISDAGISEWPLETPAEDIEIPPVRNDDDWIRESGSESK